MFLHTGFLPWDRKSHLTRAILPRLSHEGYIHWLYWNSSTCLSSDIIVMLKWRHHVKLYLSILRDFWELILRYKKQWWARKRIHYSCGGRIEKSVPRDHRLSSLGKPRDAKLWSSGQIFYPTLTLMIDSYTCILVCFAGEDWLDRELDCWTRRYCKLIYI